MDNKKTNKTKTVIKKSSIGLIGGLVVLLGLVLVPYPGPGWLIVFAGLAILATEFDRARQVLDFAKGKYEDWQVWLKKQSYVVQAAVWLATFAIVIVTIWLLNGYGLINDFLNLGLDWIRSPLPFFS